MLDVRSPKNVTPQDSAKTDSPLYFAAGVYLFEDTPRGPTWQKEIHSTLTHTIHGTGILTY